MHWQGVSSVDHHHPVYIDCLFSIVIQHTFTHRCVQSVNTQHSDEWMCVDRLHMMMSECVLTDYTWWWVNVCWQTIHDDEWMCVDRLHMMMSECVLTDYIWWWVNVCWQTTHDDEWMCVDRLQQELCWYQWSHHQPWISWQLPNQCALHRDNNCPCGFNAGSVLHAVLHRTSLILPLWLLAGNCSVFLQSPWYGGLGTKKQSSISCLCQFLEQGFGAATVEDMKCQIHNGTNATAPAVAELCGA